jgi:uncharacterized protein YyaL (SSP411 family)
VLAVQGAPEVPGLQADSDLLSANAVMADVLLRPGHANGEARYKKLGKKTTPEAFAGELARDSVDTGTLGAVAKALG